MRPSPSVASHCISGSGAIERAILSIGFGKKVPLPFQRAVAKLLVSALPIELKHCTIEDTFLLGMYLTELLPVLILPCRSFHCRLLSHLCPVSRLTTFSKVSQVPKENHRIGHFHFLSLIEDTAREPEIVNDSNSLLELSTDRRLGQPLFIDHSSGATCSVDRWNFPNTARTIKSSRPVRRWFRFNTVPHY